MTRSSTSYAVWLYYRFNLSRRDIEDLLAERGITVNREAIRLSCIKFGGGLAKSLEYTPQMVRSDYYQKYHRLCDPSIADAGFVGVPYSLH